MKFSLLLSLLFSCFSFTAQALDTQKVTDNIYALVGETGPRTAENFGSNNTVGFIVSEKGVILVGSGAMPAGAKVIEAAIQKITPKPIKWVINIGAQDHHWMGNSYFIKKGAQVLALAKTVATQKSHIDDHLNRLKSVGEKLVAEIKPLTATQIFEKDQHAFTIDSINFELIWPGNGHFPGDAVLWMPQQKILFAGDFVFLDRLLGIHPFTPIRQWQQSVHKIAELKAELVIPGHGRAAGWKTVKAQTVDYLDYLVNGVSEALEEWQELDETVDKLGNAPDFQSLKNFDSWHRRNINRTFLQLEAE